LIIDAVLELMRDVPVDPDAIVSAECHVGIANFRNLAYPEPRDEMEARFSMQYCLALALREKQLSLSDFTLPTVEILARDPLLRKISMTHYSAAEEERATSYLPHRLRITLEGGKTHEVERAFARGGRADPFSDDDRRMKFVDCLEGIESPMSIYAAITALDERPDLDFLSVLF